VKQFDKYREDERRRETLRRCVNDAGGNSSEYARRLGINRSGISKMMSGEQRVSDRALGKKNKEDDE
jgi:predicted transcriptional regulator